MASRVETITPNSSDETSGTNNWNQYNTGGAITTHHQIVATLGTDHLRDTVSGTNNTFGFTTISNSTYDSIDYIQYSFNYGTTVANEPFTVRTFLIDGTTGSTFHAEILNLTGPSNTGKTNVYTSPIYPYSSGTTKFTSADLDDIKVMIHLYDNSTGLAGLNFVEIFFLEAFVSLKTNPTAIATHDTEDIVMKVHNGDVKIGNGDVKL